MRHTRTACCAPTGGRHVPARGRYSATCAPRRLVGKLTCCETHLSREVRARPVGPGGCPSRLCHSRSSVRTSDEPARGRRVGAGNLPRKGAGCALALRPRRGVTGSFICGRSRSPLKALFIVAAWWLRHRRREQRAAGAACSADRVRPGLAERLAVSSISADTPPRVAGGACPPRPRHGPISHLLRGG